MSKSLRAAIPSGWDSIPWNFERSIARSQAEPRRRLGRLFGRNKPTLFHRCLAVHILSASNSGALK